MSNSTTWACVMGGLVALGVWSARASADDGSKVDADAAALQAMVHADWELQEKRLGRLPQSPEAIRAALRRAALLLEDLRGIDGRGRSGRRGGRTASGWPREPADVSSLDEPSRIDLYRQIRTLARELALKNPLVASRPILFMLRRRAVGYMLYEYLGWYYAHGNDPRQRSQKSERPHAGAGRRRVRAGAARPDAGDARAGLRRGAAGAFRDAVARRSTPRRSTSPSPIRRARTPTRCRATRRLRPSPGRSTTRFTSWRWMPTVRGCGSSPTARTTISIPVRFPTEASRSSPRDAAASSAAAAEARSWSTRCTAWTPTAGTSARCRFTKRTSGIRPC